jgi:hypothetical protein
MQRHWLGPVIRLLLELSQWAVGAAALRPTHGAATTGYGYAVSPLQLFAAGGVSLF